MKKYGNKNKDDLTPEEKKYLTLKITKGRWGTESQAHLKFDGSTMSYTEISENEVIYGLRPRTAVPRI